MVRELLGGFEILHQGAVIARHAAVGRHQVVMEPAHYAGLLRPGGRAAPVAGPPRHDPGYDPGYPEPRYPAAAEVAVRDLGVYAAAAEEGGR